MKLESRGGAGEGRRAARRRADVGAEQRGGARPAHVPIWQLALTRFICSPMAGSIAELKLGIAAAWRESAELRRRADDVARDAVQMERALARAKAQRARTEAFWSAGGNLLVGVTDDTLLCVASFLSAKDLLQLGLVCVRLGAHRVVAEPVHQGDGPSKCGLWQMRWRVISFWL